MNHTDLLKRAFTITWRYRPLWLFGFLLALCGGGGGGGSGNFNFSSDSFGDEMDMPGMPQIDESTIIAIIVAFFCLIIILSIIGVVVQMVSHTALIGMVDQIESDAPVEIRDGWRIGWSARAWRVFLIGLVIGIPLTIVIVGAILLAMSPLLLLLAGDDNAGLMALGIGGTILAVLAVILLIIVISAVIAPIRELTWRYTVLDETGVFDSFRRTFAAIKQNLKDVVIIWLLLFGVGLLWGVIYLITVLPVSLLAALLVGGIPALLVYLLSESFFGAMVAGGPLAVLVIVLISSFATGLYLIFHSSVWTLTYRSLSQPPAAPDFEPAPEPPPTDISAYAPKPDPQPDTPDEPNNETTLPPQPKPSDA